MITAGAEAPVFACPILRKPVYFRVELFRTGADLRETALRINAWGRKTG